MVNKLDVAQVLLSPKYVWYLFYGGILSYVTVFTQLLRIFCLVLIVFLHTILRPYVVTPQENQHLESPCSPWISSMQPCICSSVQPFFLKPMFEILSWNLPVNVVLLGSPRKTLGQDREDDTEETHEEGDRWPGTSCSYRLMQSCVYFGCVQKICQVAESEKVREMQFEIIKNIFTEPPLCQFSPKVAMVVYVLSPPPTHSETVWNENFWSKTVFLKLTNLKGKKNRLGRPVDIRPSND